MLKKCRELRARIILAHRYIDLNLSGCSVQYWEQVEQQAALELENIKRSRAIRFKLLKMKRRITYALR